MNRSFIVLIFLASFFSTCELPERDNPWDEKATIDAESWSADGFQIQDVNLTSKKLSWTYTGDNRIEGFQIDRKIGVGEWQEEVYFAGKDEREWVDTSVLPDTTKTYTYRLTAVAGTKKSNVRTGTAAVRFPKPSNLSLLVNTDTTVNLSWNYDASGHEGFKFDRKKDAEPWQPAYNSVNNTLTSFEDKFTSGSDYFYRVYAYYREFNSAALTDSLIFPKLTTAAATSISSATAISGGTVSRGTSITARGICWSTSQNPTISLSSKTTDGSGLGAFVSSVSGLQPGLTYYVRAYATNAMGTGYGNQISFTSSSVLAAISTTAVSAITSTTAQSGGTISYDGGAAITARGVCWSTSQNPTVENKKTLDGSGAGSFSSTLTGLQPATTYFVRAYATSLIGTAYGVQVSFTTSSTLATLSTTAVSSVTSSSAQSGGTISSDGGATITARGICWSTSQTPTVSLSTKTTDGSGTGSFVSAMSGLQPGITYYVRAYATNSQGTAYGNQVNFTTSSVLATITTTAISSIATTSAESGGTISSDGGAAITARGVCWSTNQNPTTNDSKTLDGSGTGSFNSSLTGLKPGTTYYVRAYATSIIGTAYGSQQSFTTSSTLPTLSTTEVSAITSISAQSGGTITADGGAAITARGVVWSTSQNPTVSSSTKTTDGSGTGTFTSSITGLTASTTYYVRAYATNLAGTAYGNQQSFTTSETSTAFETVTNPATGKTWMDRNLGASRVATSSTDELAYGDLYQWGRGTDGHEKRTSETISTLSSSDTPDHGKFITVNSGNYDWRSPQNNNLWQGVNGINNPCPEGFRLPTLAEWNEEVQSWSVESSLGAYASLLKLPVSGMRQKGNGAFYGVGLNGYYWSITSYGGLGRFLYLYIDNNYAYESASYRADGNSVRCIKEQNEPNLPSITTMSLSEITSISAMGGGNISTDGGASVTARGVCWSTSQNPTVSLSTKTTDGSGTGSFISSLSGLQSGTTYYVRAYATNSQGTAYGSQVSFTTTSAPAVSTVTSTTGKVWMDRNLGASRVATSSTDDQAYGDLYQWGRDTDGHEKRTSQTTSTLSSSDTPGHGKFITINSGNYDWRSPQNNNLWQGVNGINKPCPAGFRIPTAAEWEAERASWSSRSSSGAYASPLKLPMAGYRDGSSGSLYDVGSYGYYWSGTVDGSSAQGLSFYSGYATMFYYYRASGGSVRCLKD